MSKARSKSSTATTPPDASASASSRSSPASSGPVTLAMPSLSDSVVRSIGELDPADIAHHPAKKMRLAAELSTPSIAVLNAP
ncbi:hypothetical protein ONZ51_g12423 [Trametes cubensis]|uniref:Uncharacterized protein n=1 Tax=Trametes cubensis TaxID=1111947 RepID=A0AAD7TFT8_9APHY|nr:hypothetical protein ONZ51_g12423 [Trametes cubensis]